MPGKLEEFEDDDDWDYQLEESLVPITDKEWKASTGGGDELMMEPSDGEPKKTQQRFPNPFEQKEKPKEPEKEKPKEPEKPKTPEKGLDRVALKIGPEWIPDAARDAADRTVRALAEVREGQPISKDVRERLEKAFKDAALIDPAKAAEEEKRIVAELESKTRKLPNGKELPAWPEAKEKALWENLSKTQKALMEIPEDRRQKIVSLQMTLNSIPLNQPARRMQIEMLIVAEGDSDKSGKVKAYLSQKTLMDKFAKDNADGLERRKLHQQEMSLLHAPAVCAALYAVALDRGGSLSDLKTIEKHIKTAISDKFVATNFPDVLTLKAKYAVNEDDPLDDAVPGRASLKKAMSIMDDPAEGTAVERLKKAERHFQLAVGAADEIDMEKVNKRLEEVAKQAAELGDDGDPETIAKLDKEGTELLEKVRQQGLTRLRFALALNLAAVESKDEKLQERAVTMLKAIQKTDPGAAKDPLIQGVLKIVSEKPMRVVDMQEALEVGRKEVERIKAEEKEKGVKEEDRPYWQKLVRAIGDNATMFAAFYLLSYAFKPLGAAKNYAMRNWNMYKQLNRVEVQEAEGLKPGETKLVHKDASGKERDVSGVRAEDGKLRVIDGESADAIKLKGKDKLVLKVAPGTKLTPEQVRAAATKLLTPKTAEQILQDMRRQYDLEVRQKQLEIEDLKARQAEFERTGGRPSEVAEGKRPAADELFNDPLLKDAERRAHDRPSERPIAVEAVEGPNGLKVLADKVAGRELVKRLEQFNSDKAFREMLEREIKNAKEGSEERRALEKELEKYNGLSVRERDLMRQSALTEAIEMHNARMEGRSWRGTALKAIGVAGTLIAIGMLAELILSNCKSGTSNVQPPATPTAK